MQRVDVNVNIDVKNSLVDVLFAAVRSYQISALATRTIYTLVHFEYVVLIFYLTYCSVYSFDSAGQTNHKLRHPPITRVCSWPPVVNQVITLPVSLTCICGGSVFFFPKENRPRYVLAAMLFSYHGYVS